MPDLEITALGLRDDAMTSRANEGTACDWGNHLFCIATCRCPCHDLDMTAEDLIDVR